MEQEVYRHVPYDIDIEQALLGAMLVDNQAIERASAQLRPEHFYDPLHQRIYEIMVGQFERGGMVITPLTLHAAMKADPGLIEVGGHGYLAGLAQAAPGPSQCARLHAHPARSGRAPRPNPYRRGHRQHRL